VVVEKKYIMKVGITFSTFDLFHAGHVKLMQKDQYLKEGGYYITKNFE